VQAEEQLADSELDHDPGLLLVQRSDPNSLAERIDNAGRSTRKRGRGHIVDELNLNVCLCGSVVDPSMESVVKCKRPSCETQWVSKF
jgi:hypothetical protein